MLTCLVILSGCKGRDYRDPDQVAEACVRTVIAGDGSHPELELTDLNPELQRKIFAWKDVEWKVVRR